jgi:inorganic pyrophosphatase
VYPANYGFIPKTLAEDGDPLDVLVLCGETIFPQTLVCCYPIGVITMLDGDSLDEKIIAVPVQDPTYNNYYDIHELPKHVFEEMMHFFEVYKTLEHKHTTVKEICHKDVAMDIIAKCINAYQKEFGK